MFIWSVVSFTLLVSSSRYSRRSLLERSLNAATVMSPLCKSCTNSYKTIPEWDIRVKSKSDYFSHYAFLSYYKTLLFAFFFFKQKCAYFSSRRKILKRKSTDTECPDNEPTKTQICKERLYLPEPPKARKILFYFTGNRRKNTSILLVAWISLDYDNSDVSDS